jgi:hypothetical protein
MPLILNPSYKLRNEGNKILLYKVDWFGMMEKLQFIHPLYAILLSLFDGKKELESVGREFCYITNCSPFENGKRVIEEMLKVLREDKEEEILVDISTVDRDKIKIYEPESFIIERKKINFEDFRLSPP